MTRQIDETLHSDAPIVAIEAPAGCGKTWTAAKFAREASTRLETGKVLLLSHTHAACGEFQKRCLRTGSKISVETCDSFSLRVVGPYAGALGLPYPLEATLGRARDGIPFSVLSEKAVELFQRAPTVAKAVAASFPTIILDEHQDASRAQHRMIMLLREIGFSKVRAFADPMQAIHPDNDDGYVDWETFWNSADAREKLSEPHRWSAAKELGDWIGAARSTLKAGNSINLADAPAAVRIRRYTGLAGRHRFKDIKSAGKLLHGFLNETTDTSVALAFLAPMVRSVAQTGGWRAKINEGASLESLDTLLDLSEQGMGDPQRLSHGLLDFLAAICKGLTAPVKAGLAARLGRSVDHRRAGSVQQAWLTPFGAVYENPNHRGLARAMGLILDGLLPGFAVRLPEHAWALRSLARVDDPRGHLRSLSRLRRRRELAPQTVSSIHKAKGLEFGNVLLCPVDGHQYPAGRLGSRLLYVGLSRATRTVQLALDLSNSTTHIG
jgi:hypothetical protein